MTGTLSRKKESQEEKKDRRTSKQELCLKLDSVEPNASKSPDRIHRLYALLQSTGKGASRFGKASKDFFNENIKMNQEQTKKLYLASTELDKI